MPAAVVPSPLAASLSSALHRTPSQSRPKSDGKTSVDLSNANAHANVSSRATVARTTAVAAGPTGPLSQLTADIPSIPSSSASFSSTPTSSSGHTGRLSSTAHEKRVLKDFAPKDPKHLRTGSLAAGPSRTNSQGQLVANLHGGFAMGSNPAPQNQGGQPTKPFLWTVPKPLPNIFEVKGATPKRTFTLKEKPEVPGGDDVVYAERGSHEPPKWDSAKAQPKKSCFAKYRYHPYRNPTIPRTDAEVTASLKEAFKKRLAQNYEGPKAIAIHDATTDIPVPGTTSWKWQPKNRGPPGAFDFPEGSNLSMSSPASSTGFLADDEADAEEKEEVAKMLFPPNGKKRKFEEDLIDEMEDLANPSTQSGQTAPARKKIKTSQRVAAATNLEFAVPARAPAPSCSVQASSPSCTSTAASSTECSAGEDTPMFDSQPTSTSTRKARFDRSNARLRFAEPTGMHPIRNVKDSLDLHQGRIKGRSRGIVSEKKKCSLKRSPSTWTAWETHDAKILKGRWESVRKAKFGRHTCLNTIRDYAAKQEELDPLWVQWGTVVERFEAAYPQIDLAGVRAKHIRPAKCEEPGTSNKEATRMLEPSEVMRGWYPAWEHPAWEGIPQEVLETWRHSPHYQVVVGDVRNALSAEESERKRRWAAEATERTDAETVADGEEDAMRRAFVAEGTEGEEVPPPPAPLEDSPLKVIPALRMSADAEAAWEARWSAPNAHRPTQQ
ncbi:hypothetical protein FRB90_004072 [Tulasnella sp. 427]|nr:hypothetical protein FRB90_004072 [Tulasnella sp. 427]